MSSKKVPNRTQRAYQFTESHRNEFSIQMISRLLASLAQATTLGSIIRCPTEPLLGVTHETFRAADFFLALLAFLAVDFSALEGAFFAAPLAGVRFFVSKLCWSNDMKSTTLVAAPSRGSGSSNLVVAPADLMRFLMMSDRRARNSSW